MNDPRIVRCSCCDGEGRIRWPSRQFDNCGNEMEHDEECEACEGTGSEIIETEPIRMEELPCGAFPE